MKTQEDFGFLSLCKNFRIVTYVVTSLMYLLMGYFFQQISLQTVLVILGMGVSCFLGNYMYSALEDQEFLTQLTFLLELFAYGIFVFVSGGFSSAYFWYYICCLLIIMKEKKSTFFLSVASLWCLFCAWVGISEFDSVLRLKINMVAGVAMTLGSYYILKLNADKVLSQQRELTELNKKIIYENERSEYALLQLSNIYETFDILAMRDPEEIIRLLADVLRRTIAPKGLLLMKVDIEGNIVEASASDFSTEAAAYFIRQITAGFLAQKSLAPGEVVFNDELYDVLPVSDEVSVSGMIIRKQIGENLKEKEKFYIRLTETVFKNMDMHTHMEEYITSEEKNRIADEIHDTAIQKLFGISCSLKTLEMNLDNWSADKIRLQLQDLENSSQLTMKELRETIYGNRFDQDGDEDVKTRIMLYMSEVARMNDVSIQTDIDDEIHRLQSAKKIVLYRIACESVNNAVRHGGAENIQVNIVIDERKVMLNVVDDGCGFRMQKEKTGGNGLRNMRRMANLLKGSVSIEDREGGGVTVRLILLHE